MNQIPDVISHLYFFSLKTIFQLFNVDKVRFIKTVEGDKKYTGILINRINGVKYKRQIYFP